MSFPQRIGFVTPSLEAGRDGVGDYTIGFCQELLSKGIECEIIALHDPWVKSPQDYEQEGFRIRRIPSHLSWGKKRNGFKKRLPALNPIYGVFNLWVMAFKKRVSLLDLDPF